MFTQLRESMAHIGIQAGKSMLLSLFLFCSAPAWALPPARAAVIITEVMANPESGPEWVELTNVGEEAVLITNYTLYDAVSSPTLLVTVPDGVELASFQSQVLQLAGTSLNNSGDAVTLYNPLGEVVHTATYPTSTKGLSWQYNVTTTTYYEAAPNPGSFSAEAPPSPSPSPSPNPSPSPVAATVTPSPTPNSSPHTTASTTTTENNKQIAEAAYQEQEKQRLALTTNLVAALAEYPKNRQFATIVRKDTEAPFETAVAHQEQVPNFSLPAVFEPPKTAIILLVIGGILMLTASYWVLYVLAHSTENTFP